ncbi:oysgedart isoform a [Anaeramoeba flamelloides]|uniref:Oysgedart isoform a n=1 Tax=Anaeramoeba flamelloides TaxID=1746091 RepID=A0AAV8A8S2_9EUKA|nr:oysgedart isoform a [Anaeramoeba flamelloides]
MDIIDKQFEKISFGQPTSHIKLISMAFLAYPLALILRQIKRTNIRHLFVIIPGFFIMIILFGLRSLHLIGISLLVYLILRFNFPHKLMCVWVTTFTWLSYLHYKVESNPDPSYKCEVTGSFMIMTLKLISLASNLIDGEKDPKKLRGLAKIHRIQKMPSFLEFISYLFYFGSLSIGPIYDFTPYKNFITRKMFVSNSNNKKSMKKNQLKENEIHKKANWEGLKILLLSLCSLFLYMLLAKKFNYDMVTSENIQNSNFIIRHLNFYLLGFYLRNRYYLAFMNTEGANIIAGFGYNGIGEDGTERWDRLTNVKLKPTELPIHSRDYLNNWNYQVHLWMKNYVYFRIYTKPSVFRKSFGQLATFFFSSFWHGFRHCYYLVYPIALPFDYADRTLMKAVQPLLKDKDGKPNKTRVFIYETINRIIVTLYWSGTITIFFVCYNFKQMIILLKMVYMPVIVLPWIIIIVLTLKRFIFKKKRSKPETGTKESNGKDKTSNIDIRESTGKKETKKNK